jgi:hypothetical protein
MLDKGSELDRLTGLGLLLPLELVTERKKKIKKMCIHQGYTDFTVKDTEGMFVYTDTDQNKNRVCSSCTMWSI